MLNIVPYGQLSKYRTDHYGKHVPGHPLSQVGHTTNDGDRISASTIVGAGATAHEFYVAGSEIAMRTHGVYQYTAGSTVIKVTVVTHEHVEVTFFRPRDNGTYELITSYDEYATAEVEQKINDQIWK
jgi:hypothetical protein